MKFRLGLTALLVTIATLTTILGGWIGLRVAAFTAHNAGVDPSAVARIESALTAVIVLLAGVVFGATYVGARALARALSDIRIATLARARGEADLALRRQSVLELNDLALAVDRMHERIVTREDALSREMTDVAVAIDSVSEGIVRLDANGRLLRANPAARSLLGLSDRATGQPVATQIRHADLRRIFVAISAGNALPPEEVAVDDRRLIVSAQPLRDLAGLNAGAVLSFVDLTEVRRLESMRRDFVANVSHELKTPLTSIRGYTETMLTDDELPLEMRRQFLEVVHKNANRLHAIVDDLLDLSRIESGRWQPELHQVNALEVIDDVWSACQARARDRNISFVPPAGPAPVMADPGALRQVLTNLLDNALRYTPDGGRIEVSVRTTSCKNEARTEPHADLVTFEVRDNGTGIPTDALSRIFERFYRVDPARSRAEGGTGLGLAIVRHLIESMGGEVSAESELGKGTTIRFRLPAAT